jgi:nucleotidyltransferase substrate binding protein (TIGR01987 family)
MQDNKLAESADLFSQALTALQKSPTDRIAFAGASKCFEVAFEYAWKWFKRQADTAGFEVYGPRDSIKAAAQLGLIQDIQRWERFLHARNLSVHDYLGISDADFSDVMSDFDRALVELKVAKLTYK